MRATVLFALLIPFAFGACGDDVSGVVTYPDMSVVPRGEFYNYAAYRVTLPKDGKDFAFDLDGDGKPDNQLGLIVNLLDGAKLDIQLPVDVTIRQGDAVVLFSLQTADNTLKNDVLAALTYYLGQSFKGMSEYTDMGVFVGDGGCTACPDFSGAGTFKVDTNIVPATLTGSIKNGHFASDNPVTTKKPATLRIRLALAEGQTPAEFIINGAHIEFDTALDGNGKPTLTNGRIAGSIKNEDVQKNIVPAIAVLLTDNIKRFPNVDSTNTIRNLFDKGMCSNPDGTKANAGDDKIETCEVANSGLIKVVLGPDVAIYDKNGNYAPDKTKASPDSISVGLAFEAIQGAFARP